LKPHESHNKLLTAMPPPENVSVTMTFDSTTSSMWHGDGNDSLRSISL